MQSHNFCSFGSNLIMGLEIGKNRNLASSEDYRNDLDFLTKNVKKPFEKDALNSIVIWAEDFDVKRATKSQFCTSLRPQCDF